MGVRRGIENAVGTESQATSHSPYFWSNEEIFAVFCSNAADPQDEFDCANLAILDFLFYEV